MKKTILLVLLISLSQVFSQKSINNYEYIIVPSKFDFVKTVDGYQTSSLTKFLFNKYGFKAFLDNEEIPEELQQNNCKGLKADVVDNSKMLSTKSVIQLKNCSGKLIYASKEGISRDKNYKKAYHATIREAFESIKALNYKYQGSKVKKQTSLAKQVNSNLPKTNTVKAKKKQLVQKASVLKAKSIENGLFLQGKDKSFKVFKTSLPNVYAIEKSNGLFYKDEQGLWNAEFTNETGKKIIKKYNLIKQ